MPSLRVHDFDARHGSLLVAKDKAGAGRTVPLPENVVAFPEAARSLEAAIGDAASAH
jgi:hypothetical protein